MANVHADECRAARLDPKDVAKKALAIARGEQLAASIWHNEFEYVPVRRVEEMRERAAKEIDAALVDQSSRGRWIARRHAEIVRSLPLPPSSPEDQGQAAAALSIADPDGEARS